MNRIGIVLAVLVGLTLGGCTNNFERNYQGEIYAPIEHAFALTEAPSHARLIGTSLFVSEGAERQAEALRAAQNIGAHYVVWDRQYIGSSTRIDHIAVQTEFHERWDERRGDRITYRRTEYVPVLRTQHWHEYYAEFYRSSD
ncbi:MAG: hypothetical protein AAGB51_13825 [Planctomycetota bacterium]